MNGMRRRQRRAISYILSVVMMTLITTSMATVVLLWGLNEVGTSRDTFSSAIRARMERAQERLTVEDVYFDGSNTLTVYVRNTGGIQIVVDVVYIDHVAYTVTKTSIGVRELASITVTVSLTSGQTYLITVATTRGSTATDYWTV